MKKNSSRDISLELVPEPLVLLRTNGEIYDINSSCAKLAELNRDELIGTDFRDHELFKHLEVRIQQCLITRKEDFDRVLYRGQHFEVLILPFKVSDKLTLIRVAFKDITSFVRLEEELLTRNKELIIINNLSKTFISSDNMDLVVEDLMGKVLLVTDFGIGWLLLKHDHSYKLKTSKGISAEFQKNIEDGALEGLCSEAIHSGVPLYISEPGDTSRISVFRKEGIVFFAAIPLISEKNFVGFLFLASKDMKKVSFDFDIASLLSLIGNNVSLILDKIKLFEETKRLSITDVLTGLYNRRHFYKHLDIEVARSKRYGSSFALMLFDIDNFKSINDNFGHQAGDEVLQGLANILRSISRETDLVVRYGGEEFIIILPNTSEQEAISLANRIKYAVEHHVFQINKLAHIAITLSGGIASFPKNAADAKSLLSAADHALYAAKASGKNKILCFKGTFNEKSIQKV